MYRVNSVHNLYSYGLLCIHPTWTVALATRDRESSRAMQCRRSIFRPSLELTNSALPPHLFASIYILSKPRAGWGIHPRLQRDDKLGSLE